MMITATVSCKKPKKDFIHSLAKNVKCLHFFILNLLPLKKDSQRKNQMGRKKGIAKQLGKLILNNLV